MPSPDRDEQQKGGQGGRRKGGHLTELERHAGELAPTPQNGMLWNYRQTLGAATRLPGTARSSPSCDPGDVDVPGPGLDQEEDELLTSPPSVHAFFEKKSQAHNVFACILLNSSHDSSPRLGSRSQPFSSRMFRTVPPAALETEILQFPNDPA